MKLLNIALGFVLSLITFTSFAAEASLEEKIGQMLIIGFEGKTIDAKSPVVNAINKHHIGGVILFDFNSQTKQFDKNIESPGQVKQLNQELQLVNRTANTIHHRPQLPLLISIDYEGGKVTRLKEEYGFPAIPSAQQMGKMPLEKVDTIAKTMGETLKKAGFNLDFAPVLDVNVNPENPVIGKRERSFSENPTEVTMYADLFSKAFINHGMQCVYKHFPGHGSANADSHLSFVDVTDTWQEHELIPYQQLLASPNHCGMIMTAHIVNRKLDASGVPATLSHTILTGILRHQFNFDGVIVTDDMQMRAISDNYGLENALTLAINAGADMLIFGNQLTDDGKEQNPEEIIQIIAKKVVTGEISEERIKESYQRIIKLKKRLS